MTSNRMSAFLTTVCDLIESERGQDREDIPINDIYFGVVPPPVGNALGLAQPNCAVGKIDQYNLVDDSLAPGAHEVGHCLGRAHAGCNVHPKPEGEPCDPIPSVFPYAHSNIGAYGYDTYQLEVVPPGDPSGAHTNDFMSYGPQPLWISDYTYRKLFDVLHAAPAALDAQSGPGPTPIRTVAPVLWVRGVVSPVSPPQFPAELSPVFRLAGSFPDSGEGSGAYRLELQNQSGLALVARNFDLGVPHADPPDPAMTAVGLFSEYFPASDAVARVLLKRGDQILAERVRSAAAPQVTLTSPAMGEVWDEGTRQIAWQAVDPDGDTLTFLVQFSVDDGASWSTLAMDVEHSPLEVDAATFPGSGQARVRVLACDGLNTVMALSERFSTANHVPLVWIMAPSASGDTTPAYDEGNMVIFEGNGADQEDALLEDAAFAWRSDRDGSLGAGRRLDTTSLTPGAHTITLSVTDSGGQVGEETVTVEIRARINGQPLADAGQDLLASVGCAPVLDGSASHDPDGQRLFFQWSIVEQPAGSQARLVDPEGAKTWLLADRPGEYAAELVVQDGQVASAPDRIVVRLDSAADRLCLHLPAILSGR